MTRTPGLDEYWNTLAKVLPDFTPEQQRVAVTLYREVARGEPLSEGRIATALTTPGGNARELLTQHPLRSFVYRDGEGRVIGFGGLAVAPMHHEFRVKGKQLWTWCAWDSLFIPALIGETVEVASPDPETGEAVQLTVSPTSIAAAEPKTAVVSFLLPDAADFNSSAANVMANFCHFVFFFTSRGSGERWATKHQGTFLYSLDEAWTLAQRLTEKQFGYELARRHSSVSLPHTPWTKPSKVR